MTNAQRSDERGFRFAFDMGDRLDKAMRVAGLGMDDMAEALDVSRGTIGNYRAGRTKPSKLQVKEWAIRTGAPLEWLLYGITPNENGPVSEETEPLNVPPTGIEPATYGTNIRRLDAYRTRHAVVERETLAPVTSITGERVA